MKNFITLIFATTFFHSNTASSQELRAKFENQNLWSDVTVESSGGWNFSAFETDRGSLRFSANDSYPVTGHLKVAASGKDMAEWKKSCGDIYSNSRLQGFGKPVLNLVANPWSTNNVFNWTGKDNLNQTATWKEIENFPKYLSPKVVVNQNRYSLSSRMWAGPYDIYIDAVEKSLNEQLFLQREEFLATGEISLDLDGDVLKFFACDLGLKLASLSVVLEYKIEPAKAPMNHWIGGNGNYDKLVKDMTERLRNIGKVTKFQAGIHLGMSLQNTRAGTEVFTLDRDEKLFRSMFKSTRENPEMYELKLFSSIVEITKAFYTLAELELDRVQEWKRETEVEMSDISITVGR